MRITSLCTALSAAILISLSAPVVAAAAEPTADQIDAAKEHFGKGKELYEKGDKKGAVDEFRLAYKLSKNALLLYNIGIVYDELGDKPMALHYFEKFLTEAPDNDKTKENKKAATSRVSVLKVELNDDLPAEKPVAKPAEKPAEKPAKAVVTAFTHRTLDEAPPGQPLDLVALIPPTADWKLSLYYRTQGKDDFTAIKMKPRYDEQVGRIPAEELTGKSVQYYIEVKDGAGKLVAQSGTPASPNIVYLETKARPHFYVDENSATLEQPVEPTVVDDGKAGEGLDDEDPFADTPSRPEAEEPLDLGVPQPDGKIRDQKVNWAKWSTTAGAGVLLGTSLVLYFTASSYASQLEDDAHRTCTPSPCLFDGYAADLQSKGKSMELWSGITFGAGVATAAVAGYFWYKDLTRPKKLPETRKPNPDGDVASRGVRLMAAPLLGPGVVGGAAVLEF